MFDQLTGWRRLLGALAVLALVFAACGDDDDDAAGDDITDADDITDVDDTTDDTTDDGDAAVGGETVDVTAVDFAFEGLPTSVAAGTTIGLTNESDVELHEFVAVRLPDDEDRSVEELLQLPEEELIQLFPAVTDVIIAPPGSGGMAVEGDGVLEDPGRYAVICAIPLGADPQEYMEAAQDAEGGPPEVEGGPPHFTQGMFAELTVEASG